MPGEAICKQRQEGALHPQLLTANSLDLTDEEESRRDVGTGPCEVKERLPKMPEQPRKEFCLRTA
jgi:hypothetical protein